MRFLQYYQKFNDLAIFCKRLFSSPNYFQFPCGEERRGKNGEGKPKNASLIGNKLQKYTGDDCRDSRHLCKIFWLFCYFFQGADGDISHNRHILRRECLGEIVRKEDLGGGGELLVPGPQDEPDK